MAKAKTEKTRPREELMAQRKHVTLDARSEQLAINVLGWRGGRPYVNERLSRFSGESNIDWEGGDRSQFLIGKKSKRGNSSYRENITGRREQTHNIPYLGRFVSKINQYTLGESPKREGIDPEFKEDVSRDGWTIDQIMSEVNSYLTVCKWCWIKIDAPEVEEEVSIADKKKKKLRPYWTVKDPRQIVDWKITSDGVVQWVLDEWEDYVADDPREEPETITYRTLWEPGKITRYRLSKDKSKIVETTEKEISLKKIVPYVPVGHLSALPHWFDDTEGVNRSMLNLGSVNYANFFRCAYPQPYLPDSVLQTVQDSFNVTSAEAMNMIMGYNYPILLSKDDPTPGYMEVEASSMATLRAELTALGDEMHSTIGMVNPNPTKQVQSGISKEYDLKDLEAVVMERATILERAESRAAEISKEWDITFSTWTPEYNRSIDVGTFKEDLDAIAKVSGMPMPTPLYRMLLSKLMERAKKIGTGKMSPEEETEIIEAIKAFEVSDINMDLTQPDTLPLPKLNDGDTD